MTAFGKGVWGKAMNISAEIVSGICPTCSQNSVLISICAHNYRCTTCGQDMEQKVNGVIKYIIADKNTRIKMTEHNGHGNKG